MSTEQLAQALLTGLGAAQELLEIKRKELGDDYSKTYGYWKAERELSAALAAHEAEKAAPLTDELTGKLMRIHAALGKMGKKYGEIGSRDVDVARWNADLYEAIAAVGGVLADQPLEQLARIKLEGGQG
jgi:hypothetical protein